MDSKRRFTHEFGRALSVAMALVLVPVSVTWAKDDPAPPSKEEAAKPSAAEVGSIHAALIERVSNSVVAIKYVMNVRIARANGAPVEHEINSTVTGIVIHEEGLIMVPVASMRADQMVRVRGGGTARVTGEPSKIRVIFPGTDKEHPAILGAQDSRLGLAFILLKSTEDTALQPVSLHDAAKPTVGTTLYGVGRLDEGFDYAPYCDTVRLVGKVKTPREMWLLRGAASGFSGDPLFTERGAIVGVAAKQKGAGNSSSSQMCLLPVGVVKATIKRSLREAQRALDEALEEEAEAEEAAKEAEEAAKMASDGEGKENEDPKKDDAPKKDDGDADPTKKEDGDRPASDKPSSDEPTKEEPTKDSPKKDEPKKDEPNEDNPKKDEPK